MKRPNYLRWKRQELGALSCNPAVNYAIADTILGMVPLYSGLLLDGEGDREGLGWLFVLLPRAAVFSFQLHVTP